MISRKIPIFAASVVLTLAACGTSDPSTTQSTEAEPEPVPTEAAAPAEESAPDPTEAPVESEPDATTPPETPATDAPAEAPTTDAPATAAPDTAAPEPEPAPVGGRALAASVEPASQFEANPFPDLVVNDIGRDGQANIRNILPSERPVLLWTWAPH